MSLPNDSPCRAPADPADEVRALMWDEPDAIPTHVLVQVSGLLASVAAEEWFGADAE